jgi:phosphatidylglycerol:prolipoprotein diacylglycerol transferase
MRLEKHAPFFDIKARDDIVQYAVLGIVQGGRLGFVLFYHPLYFLENPADIFAVWQGGMSFHGGIIGVLLSFVFFARKHQLPWLAVMDRLALVTPIGLFLGRLANFVNGELYGRVTDVPWAMVFPSDPAGLPRHPSQLYQAGLEGLAMLIIMMALFWFTRARYRPGLLAGVFTTGMGIARFVNEFFREPDQQLADFAARTGLSMGQWLTIPLILTGLIVVLFALRKKPLGTGTTVPA